MERMKQRGVSFQDIRNDRGLWSVVSRSRRKRCGLRYVLRGASEASFLVATRRLADFLGGEGASLLAGAELAGVYGPPAGRCANCGAAARHALLRVGAPPDLCDWTLRLRADLTRLQTARAGPAE